MTPIIIAFGGQKGGTGKSTLAIHLAVEWMRRDRRVLLADADPQGTALTWAEVAAERGEPAPAVVGVGDNLRQTLPQLMHGIDICLIDTAGRHSARFGGALMLADLILVPTRPSPTDIWSLKSSLDAVRLAQDVRPELRAAMVINCLKNRVVISRSSREAIAKLEIPLLEAGIADRTPFSEALAFGRGVTAHAPKDAAAVELRALADAIEAMLGLSKAAHVA